MENKNLIILTTDRVGYGHIRGMLSVEDALRELNVEVESVFASEVSNNLFKKGWNLVDHSLAFLSKKFPTFLTSGGGKRGDSILLNMNRFLKLLDGRSLEKYIKSRGSSIVVASHSTQAFLIKDKNIQVYLLGLDPYPPLYFVPNKNVITTSVDEETKTGLLKLGSKEVIVLGPMVPASIRKSRETAKDRIKEIHEEDAIIATISTGGSLTHGEEIAELCKEIRIQSNVKQIKKINVIVGDSIKMLQLVKNAVENDERFNVIFNPLPINLVKQADVALGEADLIIAKTGEIPFCVSGGKAFKTFSTNPSLGPQEITIRNYIIKTSTKDNLSALEFGIEPKAEIERTLKQIKDGTITKMMTNGLQVPADGSLRLAEIIKNGLK